MDVIRNQIPYLFKAIWGSLTFKSRFFPQSDPNPNRFIFAETPRVLSLFEDQALRTIFGDTFTHAESGGMRQLTRLESKALSAWNCNLERRKWIRPNVEWIHLYMFCTIKKIPFPKCSYRNITDVNEPKRTNSMSQKRMARIKNAWMELKLLLSEVWGMRNPSIILPPGILLPNRAYRRKEDEKTWLTTVPDFIHPSHIWTPLDRTLRSTYPKLK